LQVMIAWIVSMILTAAPMEKPAYYADAKETQEERADRYNSIATDLLDVAYDAQEAPLFKGPDGRAKTAALLLSIASFESGFRKDVDIGVGEKSKGDHGRSWCLMQVQLGEANSAGHTPTRIVLTPDGTYDWAYTLDKGLGGEDLVQDRKSCFRAALHIVRVSFRACGRLPIEQKLRLYVSGSCGSGGPQSSHRVTRAMSWLRKFAPPVSDQEVVLGTPESSENLRGTSGL
jgi:hypothetical protein